jgi:hypothetical protein
VIGEPHRAFYGNQFGLTFRLFTHYGVQLWVPEVGGPLDADNEAHDLVMSVFGGMSKGERNRIKVRVRTATVILLEVDRARSDSAIQNSFEVSRAQSVACARCTAH